MALNPGCSWCSAFLRTESHLVLAEAAPSHSQSEVISYGDEIKKARRRRAGGGRVPLPKAASSSRSREPCSSSRSASFFDDKTSRVHGKSKFTSYQDFPTPLYFSEQFLSSRACTLNHGDSHAVCTGATGRNIASFYLQYLPSRIPLFRLAKNAHAIVRYTCD